MPMSKKIILSPDVCDFGKRIDSYICENINFLTRNAVQKLIQENNVIIEAMKIKKSDKITSCNTITVMIPDAISLDLTPENIPLSIVYEDDDIIVVDKPRGMVVHPAVGNWTGTLVNALMYHCGERLSGINGELRPGIVHRIDKDTSGLLVVAKNDAAHQFLSQQIANHDVVRQYEAVVIGNFSEEKGTIDKPIGRHKVDRKKMAIIADGRQAITHYHVIANYKGYSHMSFQLETGRTHQIRVHMASVGHPIIGDPLYGNKKDRFMTLNGQCLHAAHLKLVHPSMRELMVFDAPLPEYFKEVLIKIARI